MRLMSFPLSLLACIAAFPFVAGANERLPAAPLHCVYGNEDQALREFREEVNYVLRRAFPTAYTTNVCVYRESQAFPGGSSVSLVATLDAENVQGLPTQPHPQPAQVACAASGDVPCVRAHQVQAYLPGTHLESVRLPADPGNSLARVVAIVRDAGE